METCRGCGRTSTLAGNVLTFLRQAPGVVRANEVAEHFNIPTYQASVILCRLADRAMITRVRRGAYSADRELQRRALLDQLEKLTPA
ncbi:FaeA/PapI family transcriptional regulator [Mycolicibacter arupensis]|jgi:predicted transcriptional regulator of viral defense system|uniref:Uncharacterized protein n=1 Tax=Mycolicibacter arupensis TaxID=342002 RepID=A0A5C7Y8J3_9MYCO|nr:MAG: hypothetical protein E6Q54_05965 [Mycolicibacter arupensis]